jgi:hypothetical protein
MIDFIMRLGVTSAPAVPMAVWVRQRRGVALSGPAAARVLLSSKP